MTNAPYYSTPRFKNEVRKSWNVATADFSVRSLLIQTPADTVSFGGRQQDVKRLAETVQEITATQVKKHFKDDCIAHPIIDIIQKIKRHYPSLKKLNWIDDWTLGKADYKNMAMLMNMRNGKYIDMWKATTADNVPNMQKLAVFAKVLRTTGAMDDVMKLGANRHDLVVKSVCSEKSPKVLEALVLYKARSRYINPYLSGKKLIPRAEKRIDALT